MHKAILHKLQYTVIIWIVKDKKKNNNENFFIISTLNKQIGLGTVTILLFDFDSQALSLI